MDESLTTTAYHEAGHACMAVLLGAQVQCVTIEPEQDDDQLRLGGLIEVHHRSNSTARELALFEAQVSLAGPAAEMIYTGDPWHPAAVLEWQGDWHFAWQATASVWPSEQQRMLELEKLTKQIHQLLSADRCWPAVAALADELEAHETLEWEDIESIIAPWLNGHRF